MIVFLGKNSTNGIGKIKVFKDIIQEKFYEMEKQNQIYTIMGHSILEGHVIPNDLYEAYFVYIIEHESFFFFKLFPPQAFKKTNYLQRVKFWLASDFSKIKFNARKKLEK